MLSFIMLFYSLFVINVDGGYCRYSGGVLACCADSRPNCDITKDNLDSVCSIDHTRKITPEYVDVFHDIFGTCREYCETEYSKECYIWINGYDSSDSWCYCVNSCSCPDAAEINDERANSIDYDNMKSTNNNNNNDNEEIIFVIIGLIVSISLLLICLGYYLYKNNKNKTSSNYKPTNDEDQDEIVGDTIKEMKEEQAVDEIEMINPDVTQLSTK